MAVDAVAGRLRGVDRGDLVDGLAAGKLLALCQLLNIGGIALGRSGRGSRATAVGCRGAAVCQGDGSECERAGKRRRGADGCSEGVEFHGPPR